MLDEAILETVIGDDGESAARPEHANRRQESLLERTHFIVDGESKCLEDQGCGIVFSTATDTEFSDESDEIARRHEWGGVTPCDDGAGEPPRPR